MQPVACRSLRGCDKIFFLKTQSKLWKTWKALRKNVEKKLFHFSVFLVGSLLEMDDKREDKVCN